MIHGFDKTEREDINELSPKLTAKHINQKNFDKSGRLGNPKKFVKTKTGPILVKYVRYNTRNIIYRNKKVIKGKGISVTEILTAKRIKMLEKASQRHGFVNAWSQNVKIMFFDKTINFGHVTGQLWEEKTLVVL